MRRLHALLLLLIFLSGNTELHQLLRLPVLISHYKEHKQDNERINFADFIVFHYFSESTNTDFTHNELPFKENHCEALHISIAILPSGAAEEPFIIFNPESTKGIYKRQLFPSSVLSPIWQPPKA